MAAIRSPLRFPLRSNDVRVLACSLVLALVPASLQAQQQAGPKTGAQDPSSTRADTRQGETLSERLDRANGVIQPPAGTDPGIAAPVPMPPPGSTPVIPPPGTPGGDQSVQPKQPSRKPGIVS
jgi:hypothetical protein